uniref:Uncharacterized protein n=1 Tax=Arundo donax TaxID=35708 RepID=A0A0A9HIL1_ARUDO
MEGDKEVIQQKNVSQKHYFQKSALGATLLPNRCLNARLHLTARRFQKLPKGHELQILGGIRYPPAAYCKLN